MKLYKYCAFSANALSILINGQVYYSKPADFNDPFDGDFSVDRACTFEEFLAIYGLAVGPDEYEQMKLKYCDSTGMLNEEKLEKEASIIRALKNVGVLCLTPRRDSILMWSHYADKHSGLSIQFDIPDDFPVTRVNYAAVLPMHHLSYFLRKGRDDGYIDLQFTKHIDWQYEDEYRISVNGGNRLAEMPGPITEINFGCKMPDVHKKTIANMAKTLPGGNDIELFSAEQANGLSLSFGRYG
jgi:Protein of unknown function (DUF2971)